MDARKPEKDRGVRRQNRNPELMTGGFQKDNPIPKQIPINQKATNVLM